MVENGLKVVENMDGGGGISWERGSENRAEKVVEKNEEEKKTCGRKKKKR